MRIGALPLIVALASCGGSREPAVEPAPIQVAITPVDAGAPIERAPPGDPDSKEHAQKEDRADQAIAGDPTTLATRAAARQLFAHGAQEYAAGNYGTALADFERAYGIMPVDAVLYNIAQCHERLGHDRDALDAYVGYARGATGQRLADVQARIAMLKQKLGIP